MQLRVLGRSGLLVSRLGLGTATWGATTDERDAARQLGEFLDAGGTLVDTADVYGRGGSEQILGALLGSAVHRSDVVLASKAGAVAGTSPVRVDGSREYLLSALDASLRRLRTDHLDLWQLHGWAPDHPLEETLAAIDTALSSGRIRAAGVCNYVGWQTAEAAAHVAHRDRPVLASTQVEYSLLRRGVERAVIPAALDAGLGVLAWGPLGRGVLTGKYQAGIPADRQRSTFFTRYVGPLVNAERTDRTVADVVAAAGALGVAPLAVALSWVRDRPGVVAPIVGARTADQLRVSLQAADFDLPAEIRRRLDEASAPLPRPSGTAAR
jgi:aryl-alcohol dehydrogenase-like predicted oxidoreductase